jgi:hypothetical protein
MPIPESEFQQLRKRAAELMLTHRLPVAIVSKTILAGYGDGSACCLCGQPITPTQVEYELTDDTSNGDGTRLHIWCHAAWQMELAKTMSGASAHPRKE